MNRYRAVRRPGEDTWQVEIESPRWIFRGVKRRILRECVSPSIYLDVQFADEGEADQWIDKQLWRDNDDGEITHWRSY